jgi:hypothetical protein
MKNMVGMDAGANQTSMQGLLARPSFDLSACVAPESVKKGI